MTTQDVNMTSFQFYKKDTTSTHLDLHSDSFARENAQLIEQEFEPIGDIIEAENSQIAHETFKSMCDHELENLAKSQLLVGVLTAGTGGV